MGMLFVAALILAWPTFGLSIVAWIVFNFYHVKKRVDQNEKAKTSGLAVVISKVFDGEHEKFFRSLDIPLLTGYEITEEDAHQAGRLIMNYLIQNPDDGIGFLEGVAAWTVQDGSGDTDYIEAALAAKSERDYNMKANVHLFAYRAVETLMVNNKNLKCFRSVNLAKVMEFRSIIEMKKIIHR